MDVTPGSRLGPYEIVSRLGAGGMGEVFRARDTRLDRSVAIKVLPGEFAKNAQLKSRFEREAKAISQLNHPHICTLYDVGEDYLVMELLEGETLADRLARGPLPLADVLKYGAQVAEALDRAHRAGIVHRDLKPGNVMITKGGAKLLDFGLAKSSGMGVNPDGETVQHTKTLTQEGTILGTFQYMAPEQLEAEEADARTDIFALGTLLYEMATGKRAFDGKTKTSLIAAIVGAQPKPVSQQIPLSPPALDHVIQKCLEKERDDRWQSAHDVAEELRWIATIPAEPALRAGRLAKIAIAAVIALALGMAATTALWLRAKNEPGPRTAFAILPPEGHWFRGYRLSPDGTMIAFHAENSRDEAGLWVRRVDQIEPKKLTSGRTDVPIAWSPDSKWIAYMTDAHGSRIMSKISAEGGTPEVISRRATSFTGGAAWAPDGTIIYCRVFGEGLIGQPQNGGDFVPLTTIDTKRRESFHGWPNVLGDGRRFLYVIHTIAEQKNEIWAGSLDKDVKKMVVRADSLVGVAGGELYVVRDGAIYAQKFDEKALSVSGDSRRVAERVHFDEPAISALAWVGENGALLYRPIMERRVEFGWYDRNGRRIEKAFEDTDLYPRSISRDGTKVAATKFNATKGAEDIYVIDLARGIRTRLTSGLAHYTDPVWSPGGDKVYFTSDRNGAYDIYAVSEDGASPIETIWTSDRDKIVFSVSPDGSSLLASTFSAEMQSDIWLVPIAAPEKRRALVQTEADENLASFSPDGQWFVYISDRSGRNEIYMRRIDGGRTVQISTTGATGYAWDAARSALIIRTPDNARATIELSFNGNEVIPGNAVPLFVPPAADHAILGVREKGLAMWTVPDPSDYVMPLHYQSGRLDD